MSRAESKAFTKYKEEAKPFIMNLLDKHDFLSQRTIQILLEKEKYWHTVTWNAIKDIRKENKLRTAKYPPRGSFPVWVYRYDLRINDLKKKIDAEYKPVYKEFIDASSEMGFYCEDIIEMALAKAGFVTLSRNQNTKYFRGRTSSARTDLDFIAYKEGVFYGIEVKNLIGYPDWNEEIIGKKSIAEFHGIQFVMMSRALGSYGYDLFQCGGLYMEFQELIWAPKFSSLAERVKEKLYFPIICVDKPPDELLVKVKQIPFLHEKHFYGKGRI